MPPAAANCCMKTLHPLPILSHTHTHSFSVSLKSTVSKPEHLGSVEAESGAIGAKSLIFLSRLLTKINAWTLGPLCVIMGTHELPPLPYGEL